MDFDFFPLNISAPAVAHGGQTVRLLQVRCRVRDPAPARIPHAAARNGMTARQHRRHLCQHQQQQQQQRRQLLQAELPQEIGVRRCQQYNSNLFKSDQNPLTQHELGF